MKFFRPDQTRWESCVLGAASLFDGIWDLIAAVIGWKVDYPAALIAEGWYLDRHPRSNPSYRAVKVR